MLANRIIGNNSFSLCFGTTGGYFTVGGYNTKQHLPQEIVQTTSYINNSNYLILIMQVDVDKRTIFKANYSLSRLARGAMLDTGTTYTFFEARLYEKIVASIDRHCHLRKGCLGFASFNENTCVDLQTTQGQTIEQLFDSLPPLVFTFRGGGKFVWFPRDYMSRDLPFE